MSSADNRSDPFNRPTFPHLSTSTTTSSSSSSAYQSSSSLSSLSAITPSSTSASMPTPSSAVSRFGFSPAQSAAAGPLPSPTASQHQTAQYFGSLHPQAAGQHHQQHPQTQHMQEYRPTHDDAGRTAAETASLLRDYGLIAEAAKRAQMAVLMRDMEGVEL